MKNAIDTLRDVREFIRSPYAWPGGYAQLLVMHDGAVLCARCARSEYRQISHETRHALNGGWRAFGVDVHWEGPAAHCAHCDAELPSVYGDPDDEAQP